MQQQLASEGLSPIPETIGSAQAKLVYLYVDATGGATLDELTETLSLKKIDALSVLNSLSGDDLVEKDGHQYVATT